MGLGQRNRAFREPSPALDSTTHPAHSQNKPLTRSSSSRFPTSGAAERVCLSRGISSSERLDGARLAHDGFSFSPSPVCLVWKAGWPGRCGRSRGVSGLRGSLPSPGPPPLGSLPGPQAPRAGSCAVLALPASPSPKCEGAGRAARRRSFFPRPWAWLSPPSPARLASDELLARVQNHAPSRSAGPRSSWSVRPGNLGSEGVEDPLALRSGSSWSLGRG